MNYADIKVGQRLLVSSERFNSKHFHYSNLLVGEVIEKGVVHEYVSKVNAGWGTNLERRITKEGVRLRFDEEVGSPATPSHEKVTIAAKLFPMDSGAIYEGWRQHCAKEAAKVAQRTQAAALEAEITAMVDSHVKTFHYPPSVQVDGLDVVFIRPSAWSGLTAEVVAHLLASAEEIIRQAVRQYYS
jgi:hypothetical protein